MNHDDQLFSRRNLAWMIVLAVLAVVFWYLPPLAAEQDAVFRSFAPLVTIKSIIERRYVDPVDERGLVNGAIHGMVGQLDPHSTYFSPQRYPVFKARSEGGYVGIGIEMERRGRELVVVSPLEDSPAFHAGVQAGDVIIEIAGEPVGDLSLLEAVERMRGVEGSTAHFTALRPPDDEIVKFSVQRAHVRTHSVLGYRRHDGGAWDYLIDPDNKIGYVRITEFWDHTAGEFDQAADELKQAGAAALVLDVRFNPGGSMLTAVDLVDRFLPDGIILMTKNRHDVENVWTAKPGNDLPPWPVVVLANGESASGAEILAGALQDRGRATVVGERSFGKGSVQALIELDDHSALKLTTAYYYLPSGRCIHRRPASTDSDEWGIIPDIVVQTIPPQRREILASWAESHVVRGGDSPAEPIKIDAQLQRALDLLRERTPALP